MTFQTGVSRPFFAIVSRPFFAIVSRPFFAIVSRPFFAIVSRPFFAMFQGLSSQLWEFHIFKRMKLCNYDISE
jgi:hypothetical protein